MYTKRILISINVLLAIGLTVMTFKFYSLQKNMDYFALVPADKIHTMTVEEDGSFAIEYKDNTSEIGCVPEGECNE